MHRDRKIKPYRHMQYLDEHVLALTNLQLYPDGPGEPPDVYGRREEGQGEFDYLGTGFQTATSREAAEHQELRLVRPGTPPNGDGKDQVCLRLAIALPPRHGKSLLVTETLPLWFLLRHPQSSVVVATYNQEFADKWGSSARDLLLKGEGTHWSLLPDASDGQPLRPHDGIRQDLSFRTGKDIGEVHYRGLGGSLTGTGWNLGIIDDPFKDQEDALSPAIREKRKDWYTSVFRSRTTPKAGAPPALEIMMFTRWHEDDLAGAFAYEADGETAKPGWFVLKLPAIAEDDDPLGRKKGASLCPELSPLDSLLEKRTEDPKWFSCLYQGNPTHEAGALFAKPYTHYVGTREGYLRKEGGDHFLIPTEEPMYFATVDLAASLKTSADYSVASYWGWHVETGTLILVDSVRDRVSTEAHASWLDRFIKRQGIAPSFVGVENETFGTNLINEMRQSHTDYVIVPLKADKNKYTRAMPYAEAVKAGKVWFPDPDVWPGSVAWENEHSKFPVGKNDDQVDTGAYAWRKTRDYTHVQPQQAEFVAPSIEERAWKQLERMDRKKKRTGFARALNSR